MVGMVNVFGPSLPLPAEGAFYKVYAAKGGDQKDNGPISDVANSLRGEN